MLSDDLGCHAIVVLLEDEAEAESLARMLSDLCTDGTRVAVRLPLVRGIGFFADSGAQRQVDEWWDAEIPPALFADLRGRP